ncbi:MULTISPECIES: DUF5819 family protein [unclassified Leucobacter]|uniref:DUF5819 family protein n=2 Tax=Leucobacter TaxID=55968 RepID=UPI0030198E2D
MVMHIEKVGAASTGERGTADGGRTPRFEGRRSAISPAAKLAAGATVLLLAVHMTLTAIFNAPAPEIRSSSAWQLANNYIQPYLVQDYKIFAPEPIDSDRQLWLRAWVETSEGERVTSQWINATEIELAAPYRKLLRKQLSIVGSERLMAAYRGLSEAQRAAAAENHLDGTGLYPLRDAILAADPTKSAAATDFIRADNFTTSYATQVAQALWGETGTIIAVQTRAVFDPVIRWNDRHNPDAEQPASSYTDLGWTPTLEWQGQDREAFARTFRSWAAAAGTATELSVTGGSADTGEAASQTGTKEASQ